MNGSKSDYFWKIIVLDSQNIYHINENYQKSMNSTTKEQNIYLAAFEHQIKDLNKH
jgi:hypothetical protein